MSARRRKTAWPWLCALALLVLAGFGVRAGLRQFNMARYPLAQREIVEREAAAFSLDPRLVFAVIKAESDFDAQAVSPAGACGLMQLMPDTYRWMANRLGESAEDNDIFDPQSNVRCGCALLRLLLDSYDVPQTALCAYNAGMGTVSRWLEDPTLSLDGRTLESIPYAETRRYVEKILRNYEAYVSLYPHEYGDTGLIFRTDGAIME